MSIEVRFEISVATATGTTSISAAKAPAVLELLRLAENFERALRRLADGAKAAGPGAPRRDQAGVPADRDAFVAHAADRLQARGAIDRVGARPAACGKPREDSRWS